MSEISEKQLEANRENAKLGGVKTQEGKEISKMNALKHGLLSKMVLIEGEDEQSFIELGKQLRFGLKPIGELESLLLDRMIANFWRLRRANEVEKNFMERMKNYDDDDYDFSRETEEQKARRRMASMIVHGSIEKIIRYESFIEKSIYKSLHELQRIQAVRSGDKVPAPLVVDVDVSNE